MAIDAAGLRSGPARAHAAHRGYERRPRREGQAPRLPDLRAHDHRHGLPLVRALARGRENERTWQSERFGGV